MTDLEITTAVVHGLPRAVAPGRWIRATSSRWAALPVLMAGTFVIVLDFFIVNVALPSMQANLRATTGTLEWVVAGYGLTFAALLITAGRLADRLGRRRVFSAGIALFTLASLACGLAPNAETLVAARLAQGIAGAAISTTVLALIGVLYTGADRARAIGVYAMVMGVAAAGGQLIGGALVELDVAHLGWRTVFLINVPVGIVAFATTPRLVPESRAPQAPRSDAGGLLLATTGLTALVLPLVQGRDDGWPAWSLGCLAAAPVVLAAFVVQQRRVARRGGTPLLDPELFRVRSFSAGLFTQLLLWSGQASFFLVLALFLQDGRGLSALASGLVFSILAVAYLVAAFTAPALAARHGRDVIAAGAISLAVGHGVLLATTAVTGGAIAALVPGLLLVGAGMGLALTPLTTTVLASAEPTQAGAVSGALSTMQQVGNALGVAVVGVVFFGAVPAHGYRHAFELSLVVLAGLLTVVACATRLLPQPETSC